MLISYLLHGGFVSANMEVCAEAISPACDPVCLTKDGRMLKARRAVNGGGGDSHVVHGRMDGFFAAVEQVMRPKFGGRAVLVDAGVVVSASYGATFFGITVGGAIGEAL